MTLTIRSNLWTAPQDNCVIFENGPSTTSSPIHLTEVRQKMIILFCLKIHSVSNAIIFQYSQNFIVILSQTTSLTLFFVSILSLQIPAPGLEARMESPCVCRWLHRERSHRSGAVRRLRLTVNAVGNDGKRKTDHRNRFLLKFIEVDHDTLCNTKHIHILYTLNIHNLYAR